MKYCPQCHKEYTEVWITFCSDDGTILVDTGYEQPKSAGSPRPPYAPSSMEQPTWRAPDPNAPGGWISPAERQPIPSPAWQPPPPPGVYPRQQQSQGLAVASMIVGIPSPCSLEFLSGPNTRDRCVGAWPGCAVAIKRSPHLYGGKPFAIVGIVTGSLSTVLYGAFIILAIIGNILSITK
jgi:hypothetical protein